MSFLPFLSYGSHTPIVLNNNEDKYFVVRQYMEYFEDRSRLLTVDSIQTKKFKSHVSITTDFANSNTSSAYWIRFNVVNNHSSNSQYRVEMYDYDIDEVSIFIRDKNGYFRERKTGHSYSFLSRELSHKNISFELRINPLDTAFVYMRFFSQKVNTLEPVIKTSNCFIGYSLHEYLLLGIFYGAMILIVIYNLIYFLILRKFYYFYYSFFVISILLYMLGTNGIGFQYIWPSYPSFNTYISSLSISASLIFILLFINSYLRLSVKNKKLYGLIQYSILLKMIFMFTEFGYPNTFLFRGIDIVFILFSFLSGVFQIRSGYKVSIWYNSAFIVLMTAFLITWLEHLAWIPSTIYTVYALNIGIMLQFILLSISTAKLEGEAYEEKNKVLKDLITVIEKNDSMRIVELKKQMNPHFIFNALNSILQRILMDKKDEATYFLVHFSKLIRKTLNSSDKIFIPLSQEIGSLELYLSLESMRLGNSFKYKIDIDPHLDCDAIDFPSFIIQPFVENAIWHGLMPMHGEKILEIIVSKQQNIIRISITDNGIGRLTSIEQKVENKNESKGINLIKERMELIELKFKRKTYLMCEDLYDSENRAIGTRVIIEIEF